MFRGCRNWIAAWAIVTCLCSTAAIAQPNDDCVGAEPVTIGVPVLANTAAANDDGTPFCGTSGPFQGLWYSVVGTGNTLTATTCSPNTSFDTRIQVWCSCSDFSTLSCVAGNDDGGTPDCALPPPNDTFFWESRASWCSVPGVTYLILVGSFGDGVVGDFELTVSDDGVPCAGGNDCVLPTGACCTAGICGATTTEGECDLLGGVFFIGETCPEFACPGVPPNDTCLGAESLTLGVPVIGDSTAATNDITATCGTPQPFNGLWYSIVGTGNTITAETCNPTTNFDSKIQVWCNCDDFAAVNCVGGNDDAVGAPPECSLNGLNRKSRVTWCSAPGVTYFILVGSFAEGDTGTFELNVFDDGVPCASPATCSGTFTGDCCTANGTPGCEDAACTACVCGQDAFCCDTEWDGLCAGAATGAACGLECPCGVEPPPNDDCANASLVDCDSSTDYNNAVATTEGAPTSNCCVAHAGPGCDDLACQDCVCAADAFCCGTAWDGLCAGAAQPAGVCGAFCPCQPDPNGDPNFSCAFGGPSQGFGTIWFTFVATHTSAQISTCGSAAADSIIALYDGDCDLGFVELACSEDECGLQSEVCAEGLTVGNTYYVEVASFSPASQGPGTLTINCPCPRECETCLGDSNADTFVDGRDVQQFTDCYLGLGNEFLCACSDLNRDGDVDDDDIPGFVDRLLTSVGVCPDVCPPGHEGQLPDFIDGRTSNNNPFVSADNFTAVSAGNITSVRWWGAYLPDVCPTGADTFEITYFEDFNGRPGAVKAGPISVNATRTPTEDLLAGIAVTWAFDADHAPVPVDAGECVWMQIVNNQLAAGGSNCCIANGGIGCDDQVCQDCVCGLDPFCCGMDPDVGGFWDGLCAGAANPGGVCAASCPCEGAGGGGGGPGCNWFWATSSEGDAVMAQSDTPGTYNNDDRLPFDLAWCVDIDVDLNSCPLPLGACCIDQVCTGVTLETECFGLWAVDQNCEEFVCPIDSGNCCTAHGAPGCQDQPCEACVCAIDAFCCDVGWDGICLGIAQNDCAGNGCICPIPGVCCLIDVCEDSDSITCGNQGGEFFAGETCFDFTCPLTPGACCTGVTCNDDFTFALCQTAEGDFFPFLTCNDIFECPGAVMGACCVGGVCTNEIAANCIGQHFPGQDCDLGFVCPTSSGNCCTASGGFGCEDPVCQDCVCANDSFCCETAWDTLCANQANTAPCGPQGACLCEPGVCPVGEIQDCNGNCAPEGWVGDGLCDDGSFTWNGIPIFFNCPEFGNDGGDCGGGCAVDEITDCNGNCAPADWVGDGFCDDGSFTWNGIAIFFNCPEFGNDGGDCDGGGGCGVGEITDCNGNCAPSSWVGDGSCDDGTFIYNGNPIFFDCPEFGNDGGDCD